VPIPPEIQKKLETVDRISQEFEQIKIEKEDQALDLEIQKLQAKHAEDDWKTDNGEGTILDKILKTAHKYALTDLEDAYKLCTYDNVKLQTEAATKKKLEEQRANENRAVIVSGGTPASRGGAPKQFDPGRTDWRGTLEAALADTNTMK
jgi:hypothetical protein